MASKNSLQSFPTELHQHIGLFLDFLDLHSLRSTCRVFHDCLPTPIITAIHLADGELDDGYASRNDLWSCYECQRLRPADRFTDASRKSPKSRSGKACETRFCVSCGRKSFNEGQPGGGVRYRSGTQLDIKKKPHILCPRCEAVKRRGEFDGKFAEVRVECFAPTKRFRQGLQHREREAREKEQRTGIREAQAERRRLRREMWGSDYDFSDDDIPESETALVQLDVPDLM